jgi:hypothetical protein
MAGGDFWSRIRSLFRQTRSPQPTRVPTTRTQPRPTTYPAPQQTAPRQIQPPPTVPPPPPVSPVGPLDQATVMDTIAQAGQRRVLLQLTYNGQARLVEPYSMRQRSTGWQFFGFCSIHGVIHSFIPAKIQDIQVTNIPFSPRWPIEF